MPLFTGSTTTATGTSSAGNHHHHKHTTHHHHARRSCLVAVALSIPTFFMFLILLEHMHVVRYHAQQEAKLLERIRESGGHHQHHQLSFSQAIQRITRKAEEEAVNGGNSGRGEDSPPLNKKEVAKGVGGGDERRPPPQLVKKAVAEVVGDYRLPPLSSIIDEDKKIIGDPQILLQFAIIGFGKCGTSTLMHWFANHPQLQALTNEVWSLVSQNPGALVARLHKSLKKNLPRGYKCPGDINQHYVIDYYRTLFPKTKLFVGIRHPIHWFQSLYNFRIQNFETYASMPHPNRLIGSCHSGFQFTCTIKGNFAYSLLRLGKQHWNGTRETTALERQIVAPGHGRRKGYDPAELGYLPNPVFLFDLTQLADQNKTRKDALRHSIQEFLGITEDLPDVTHVTPGQKWNETVQAGKDALKMDICERQYIPLRQELMYLSRQTSEWIRTSFLDLPDVHVGNREHFEQIMESYMRDPCGTESEETSDEEARVILLETKLKYWEEALTPHEKEKALTELKELETILEQRRKN